MTPELRAKITQQAEEKYPVDKRYHTITDECWIDAERKAYISAALPLASKVEELTAEVSDLKEKLEKLDTALRQVRMAVSCRDSADSIMINIDKVLNSKEI